jgi:hypothetical protein
LAIAVRCCGVSSRLRAQLRHLLENLTHRCHPLRIRSGHRGAVGRTGRRVLLRGTDDRRQNESERDESDAFHSAILSDPAQ